jgi:hypothetical protein
MIMCWPLDLKFTGSNAAKDDGFLRVIKIHSTTSFPCHVSPASLLDNSAGKECLRALADESG